MSSREIAKVCAVGDQMVNQLRESRSSDQAERIGADLVNTMRKNQPPLNGGSETRIGADGKTRKLPQAKMPHS